MTGDTDTARESPWTKRPIGHDEAKEAVHRLIAGAFNRTDMRPRFSIPTQIDYDDDCVVMAYLEQRRAADEEAASERAARETAPPDVEALASRAFDLAGMLGFYVDPATPAREAEVILRARPRAWALGDDIHALAAEVAWERTYRRAERTAAETALAEARRALTTAHAALDEAEVVIDAQQDTQSYYRVQAARRAARSWLDTHPAPEADHG